MAVLLEKTVHFLGWRSWVTLGLSLTDICMRRGFYRFEIVGNAKEERERALHPYFRRGKRYVPPVIIFDVRAFEVFFFFL